MAQVDNSNLAAKLQLRRYFLRLYHADPPRVFDACQGSGVIWSRLRDEFTLASYWGVDIKPKKGRMRADSAEVLRAGVAADVVDIDTYGSPWRHLAALMECPALPLTVFLTIGRRSYRGGAFKPLCREEEASLGVMRLQRFGRHTAGYFGGRLQGISTDYCLSHYLKHVKIEKAAKTLNGGATVYIGLRLV